MTSENDENATPGARAEENAQADEDRERALQELRAFLAIAYPAREPQNWKPFVMWYLTIMTIIPLGLLGWWFLSGPVR
jgi:hypothetical protein